MTDTFFAEEIETDPVEVEAARLRLIDPLPLRKMVDQFRDGTEVGRVIAEKARRYYDGDQLDAGMVRGLKRARQPRVIRNEIKPAINGLLGIIQQAKVDPKAYPRNPQNEEQADVASKALRYVADVNHFHSIKVDAAENHMIEGVCGAIVEADDEGTPLITQIAFDEMIYDPRSRAADFSDARFKGLGKWLYQADVQKMYPHLDSDLSQAFSSSWGAEMGLGQSYADKPENLPTTSWLSPGDRRIFVVELYHREEKWMRSVFYVGGVLEQDVSPYLDDDGEPMCNVVLASCYIDKDNQRYGMVRSMLSPQDELNAYGSRSLHLANSRQLQVADPNFPPEVDARTASAEAAKADGVIPTGYQIVPTGDLFQGIQIMMADARQALVRQAPTPAVLADASTNSQSGRAKLVQQQAGMTEVARAFGRREDWENQVYRVCWQVLKQFKTEPWWVRITGDDAQKTDFVGINQPVGLDGEPMDPRQAQMMQALGQQVTISNKLAEMDVDIEVETIPDTANLQAEQFEGLAPMLPMLASVPEYGPKKAFEVGLLMSAIPGKARIMEILDAKPENEDPQAMAAQQQQAQMQQQMQHMAVEIEMMKGQLGNKKLESEIALNVAKTQQIEADVTMDAIKTHSDVAQAYTPEQQPLATPQE